MNWPAGFLLSTENEPERTVQSTAVMQATARKPIIAHRAVFGVSITAPTTIAKPVSSAYWTVLTALCSERCASRTTTSQPRNGRIHGSAGLTRVSLARQSGRSAISGIMPAKQVRSRTSVAATWTPPALTLVWTGRTAMAAAAAHHGLAASSTTIGAPTRTTACRGALTAR